MFIIYDIKLILNYFVFRKLNIKMSSLLSRYDIRADSICIYIIHYIYNIKVTIIIVDENVLLK